MQLVMHMKREKTKRPKGSTAASGTQPKETAAMTVRLPREDYEAFREAAEARGVSLNFLAAEALAQYRVLSQRREALAQMKARQSRAKPVAEGFDSTAILREQRLERVRQLMGERGSDEP